MTDVKTPRGEARRRAMLDAAAAVFAEKGFERTSVSDIIARSGGSRATLYEIFGDKQGLFEAMITEGCENFLAPLDRAVEGSLPEEVLTNFGIHIADRITSLESRALTKILAADGRRFPKVIDFFFRHGADLVRGRLAEYLRKATEAGHLDVSDPTGAAAVFLSMVEGEGMLRRIFDAPGQPTDQEVRDYVRLATHVFLNGVMKRE